MELAGDVGDADSLLLLSWNVAGWASTHELIKRHYASLDEYLKRMGNPAFVCIQETKVQSKDLKNEVAARKLGAVLKNYRSYWAFNDSPKQDGKGVATWVRNDISVESATQIVLGSAEFDLQGRVLLTEHSSCALVNVYAPFAGPSAEPADVQAKLHFLEALGTALDAIKVRGKRVVLCGDLNLTHRPQDQKASRRLLRMDEAGMVERGASAPLGPFADWAGQWQPVKEVAARAEVPAESLADEAECLHIREGGCVPWLRGRVLPAGCAAWADVLAEVHPKAEERFTAWSQSANLRYLNLGTRIDYVFCDRATFQECVVASPSESLAGGQGFAAAAAAEPQPGGGAPRQMLR